MSAVPLNQPNGITSRGGAGINNNSNKERENVVLRLFHVPLIQDTFNRFTAVVQSYGITAAIYSKTEQIATSLLKATEPIQQRLPLPQLNSWANQLVDVLEHHFPAAFQVHADELLAQAKAQAMKPADAAQKVFQERLTGAQASLSSAQDRLSHMVESLPRNSEDAQRAVQGVIAEIVKTRDTVMAQAKDMPANVRSNIEPMVQDLQSGMSHVVNELQRTDVPIQTRVGNSANYLKDNSAEVLNKILAVVSRKKDDAQKSYAEAAH